MFLDKLKIHNFRNYESLEISFNKRINLIYGQNGLGKSNLIEAIDFCLTGKSFRRQNNKEIINKKNTHKIAKISAQVQYENLSISLNHTLAEKKSDLTINTKKVTRSSLLQKFNTVVFSPDSLSIVKQGPNERRALIDDLAIAMKPSHTDLIYQYAKCLKTRNKVLKNYAEGHVQKQETLLLLESLNNSFLILASEVVLLRIATINDIILPAKKVLKALLKDESVDIFVDYVISSKSAVDWSENQVYDALKTRLQGLTEAELSVGQSLVGPHKHDVVFNFNGHDARSYCSQGQQRSIILAFKIAEIMKFHEARGTFPVLLLDDVFSELDVERREGLMSILNDTPAQIFITSTEADEKLHFSKNDIQLIALDRVNAG